MRRGPDIGQVRVNHDQRPAKADRPVQGIPRRGGVGRAAELRDRTQCTVLGIRVTDAARERAASTNIAHRSGHGAGNHL